jgi:hypothetical protein
MQKVQIYSLLLLFIISIINLVGGIKLSKELIMENDCAILWYHTETKILHHQIKKYAYGKDFQELLMKANEVFKTRGAKKWLCDDRHSSALRKEDEEWANNTWLPMTIENGWKYWAIVQPEKISGKLHMKKFAAAYAKKGITANLFTDPEEAMKWLIDQ